MAVPGCYPTATVLALGPLVDAGLVRGGPARGHRAERRVGRGRRAERGAALRGARRRRARLRPAHPPPHRRDGARARPHGALHAAPRPDGPRAARHLRRARGARASTPPTALAALHDAYDHEPFVVVTEDPPRPKAVRGTNVAHVTARVDPRTGWLLALCAIDNLGKGAAGQAIQCANVALRARRDRGPRARGGVAVSVVDPEGFAAAGGHVGIKAAGRPDCAVVACTTARPRRRRRRSSRRTSRPPRPSSVSRAHLAATGGRARAIVVTSGNANAATGARGRAGRRGPVRGGRRRLRRAARRGARRPDRPHRRALRLRARSPRRSRRSARRRARRRRTAAAAAHRDAHHRLGRRRPTRGDVRRVPRRARWRRARRCSRRTSRRCCAVLTTDAACEPGLLVRAAPRRGRADVQPDPRRRVDRRPTTPWRVLASGVAGPVSAELLGGALAEACASLARQMVDDAEGATRTATVSVRGAASDHQAHVGGARGRRLAPRQVLAQRRGPLLGPRRRRAGCRGRRLRARPRHRPLRRGRGRASRARASRHDAAAVAAHLAGRHVELACDLGLGSGRGSVLCCDLGPGYLDENRTTS